jgi:hypothetical protein
MRAVFLGTCLILAATAASAQFPLGQATPVNGFGAALFGEPLWIGNPGYGYRIVGAPPGGSAIVAISLARQDQTIGGLGVYLDLGSVLVTHSGPVDATGRAAFQFPLNSPDDPALTGLQFYAQGAVVDPADDSVGTTEALLIEIAAHPMVAWTTWTGTLYLLDPVEGTIQQVPGLPPTATVLDLTFANAGRDVFVASSAGIFVVDTFAAAPQAVSLLAGSWTSIAWDRVHRRAYAVGAQGLVGLDGDRASPAFGTTVAQISDGSNLASLAVSTAGNLLALATVDGIITRRDADPASPTYLQLIPMPGNLSSWLPNIFGRVQISPDGRVITMPVKQFLGPSGPVVHRFDGNAGIWVDFDPLTPGTQPLSNITHPGLVLLTGGFPTRDGSALVFTGSETVARGDLELDAPANVTVTTTPAPTVVGLMRYVGLTPSGTFLLRQQDPFLSYPAGLALVQVSTGLATPFFEVPVPAMMPLTTPVAAWR